MPSIRAILVLDSEGNRIATRYYDAVTFAEKAAQVRCLLCSETPLSLMAFAYSQEKFEKKLQRKTRNATARVDGEYGTSLCPNCDSCTRVP